MPSSLCFPDLEGLSFVERLASKGGRGSWSPPQRVTSASSTHLAHRGPAEEQLDVLRAELATRPPCPPSSRATSTWRRTTRRSGACRGGWTAACPVRNLEDGTLDLGPLTRVGWPRVAGAAVRGWRPDQVFARGLTMVDHALALDGTETALSDHNAVVVTRIPEPRSVTHRGLAPANRVDGT
ncbi:MAG: hypothetical protein R3E85_07615 [Planctomycetota bacterium]